MMVLALIVFHKLLYILATLRSIWTSKIVNIDVWIGLAESLIMRVMMILIVYIM